MSSVRSLQQQIQNLTRGLPYQRRNELENQVSSAMVNVQTLRLAVDYHTFPDGRRERLLKMHGTIPINYRGNVYNIPITVWFEYSFPQLPPLAYVTPTADMAVQQNHRHVDTAGKMYLQGLHAWGFRSSLTDLIVEMTSAFSRAPPVYAKPNNQPVKHNYNQPNYQQQQQHSSSHRPSAQATPPSYNQHVQSSSATKKQQLLEECTNKMKSTLKEELGKLTNEIARVQKKQIEIEKRKKKVDASLRDGESEKQKLEQRKIDLVTETSKVEIWIQNNEHQASIDVDTIVSASDTYSNQLFEATAEDYAYTDILYELDACLGDELIDIQKYLRHVQKIARKQYMARALAQKVNVARLGTQNVPHSPNPQPRQPAGPPPSYQQAATYKPPPTYKRY